MKPSPSASAPFPSHGPHQAAFDGLLLAFLARKRLLLLSGPDAAERMGLFAKLVERMTADGALVLPVQARPGMEVEDLVIASAAALGRPLAGEREFDALVEDLEAQLDMAGAGVLAIDEADTLAPAVLADLVELSRSETPRGRSLQILLSGGVAFATALGESGGGGGAIVAFRLNGEARPTEPRPATARLAGTGPGTGAGPKARNARTRAPTVSKVARVARWVTAAAVIALAGIGVHLALPDVKPERVLTRLDTVAHQVGDLGRRLWRDAADGAKAYFADAFARPPSFPLAPARVAPPPPLISAPPSAPPSLVQPQPLALATTPPVVAVAEAPPSPAPAPAIAPRMITPLITAAEPEPAPPTTPPAALPSPAVPSARVEDAPAPAALASPPEIIVAPRPSPEVQRAEIQRAEIQEAEVPRAPTVTALLDQARRQIAAKRLTTPPGDNAFETLSRVAGLAPRAPEIATLTAEMILTYRRWANAAESGGSPADARRFYQRALTLAPHDVELRRLAAQAQAP